MPNAILGLILWVSSKVLLPGVLVLLHWIQQRLRSVPAPLFRRTEAVRGRTRLSEGALGFLACYGLCAAVYFFSMLGQPWGTSLTLNPVEGSPAARAGLLPGDRAKRVGGTPVETFEQFRDRVAKSPRTVSIEVERGGRRVDLSIRKNEDNVIGVVPEPGEPLDAGGALSRAVIAPASAAADWVSGLVHMLLGADVRLASSTKIGAAASGGGATSAFVLASLLTFDLLLVVFVHAVVLVVDARARQRYQADHAALIPR